METHDKIFLAIIATVFAVLMLMPKWKQVDISPAPESDLPDEPLNMAKLPPPQSKTPQVSRWNEEFIYPLNFMRPMPITSMDTR